MLPSRAFNHVKPVVEHWFERDIARSVHHEGSTHRTMSGPSTTELHLTDGTKEGNGGGGGANDALHIFYLQIW